MPRFDLENYETVADRIARFWQEYPEGRIETAMIHISDTGKQFVVQAFVYKAQDGPCVATGLAEEHFSDRGPNETSPLENCETSAIGRALANMGYATSSESRPSREEMAKVNAKTQNNAERAGEVREQVRSNSPRVKVADDPRWERIVEAASSPGADDFLKDIASKGKKFGELTSKQIGAAFNAASKVLDTAPRSGTVKKVAEAFGVDEEPF